MNNENNKLDLETKLKELEKIAEEIQDPNVGIDRALELYKKGIQISNTCKEVIASIETEVENLSKEQVKNKSIEINNNER